MATQHELCVVFADVSGSTRLYETLGDAGALAAIDRCIDAMTRATQLNRGRVVKTIGDEVMAVFDSASQGMQATSEMQQRIDDLPSPTAGVKLAIRAGLHFGPTLVENEDVFGDTVNIAARMSAIAKAGQIITTGETVAALPELQRQSCREIDRLTVKGKEDQLLVCEILWQDNAELTMVGTRMALPVTHEARLRLQHGDQILVLGTGCPAISLGRDPASDIIIHDPRASRSHARIEHRRDKFVLADMSSNGTFVTVKGETEFALKREEIILRGEGRVVFGHAWSATQPTETLMFRIEV
jgi:class 3 adenylate cyclase